MDRLSYRTHTQLMLDSENRKIERKRSELAQEALKALKRAKKARTYATLREAGVTALEWLLAALLCAGGTYVALYLLSEYACTFRGVC